MIYNRLGRAAIRFSIAYLRRRYKRQLRIGAGIAVVAAGLGLAAFLTKRDVPEG